jgi:hypothetical protein
MMTPVRLAVAAAAVAAGLGLAVGSAVDSPAQVGPLPQDPCTAGVNCANPGPAPNIEPAPRSRYVSTAPDDDLSGRGSDGGGGGG